MGIIIRQSIKSTVINYIGAFIGFITTFFIITRYLTSEEIGLTRVLIEAATLFAGLAQLGTNSSLIRFFPHFKDEEKKDHGVFFWSLIIPLVGFFIMMAVFIIFKDPIIGFFIENSALFVKYYNYVIPLGFFMLYISVFETNSNVLMRIAVPKFIREVAIRLCMIVVYVLYAFKIFNLDQFVIAFCSVYGIALILNIIYQFSLKKVSLVPDMKFITPKIRREFLLYTVFLITAALTGSITPMINTFFLSAKMGLSYAGIFTIATFIAAIVEIPYRSLGAIASPQVSQSIRNNNIKDADKMCKSVSLHQLLAGSIIFYFIWINIDVIFQIIPGGEEYAVAKWAVFIIALSRLLNSVFSIGAVVLTYSRYYYFSLIFTFILTALTIYLNLLWIPKWGIEGAVLGTLVSYMVYYVLLLALIKWKVGTSPFSMSQLKVVLVVAALFLLNYLWNISISPLIQGINGNELFINIIDRLSCSLLMLGIGVFAIYKMKISAEANTIADRCMNFCFSKLKIKK